MDLRKVDNKGHQLDRGAADAYAALLAHARLDGIAAPSLEILSAYRSVERQTELWNTALVKYGTVAEARKWVALPGHSDHQRGIAIDFCGPSGEDLLTKDGAGWVWLDKNASQFGFKPYTLEPWHWAYKGSWSTVWAGIPSWLKWSTGGAIALLVLTPGEPATEAA